MPSLARVLAIGGSDSGGGAGIQADIKTVAALGGFAATAITAITAQNTLGVTAVQGVTADMVQQQIEAVLDDIGVDVIKTGMLWSTEIVATVCTSLKRLAANLPLVVDPVLVSTTGSLLLAESAINTVLTELFPLADIVTPNVPEAEQLSATTILDKDTMRVAARHLLQSGAKAVLIKGGHLPGTAVSDLLVTIDYEEEFTHPRIDTRHNHGTGCTLAAAIATRLAQGRSLRSAVFDAQAFVAEALRTAPGFGRGHGPLNHSVRYV